MDSLLPKSKVCTGCGEEKLLEEFGRRKDGKYGRKSKCKVCTAECYKQYYQDNREKIAERQKQYYQDNKEKTSERKKQWRQDNKEQLTEKSKKYYQDNKEKRKQYVKENREKLKQYRHDNKEHRNELERTRCKNDEQYRIRCYLKTGLWIELNKIEKTKTASILTYIGCTIEFMQEHLNSTKKPEWGDDLHIDHIIPKSLFDHANEEEVNKCWNWRNLRYIPAEENRSKGNTLDMGLVKSYGIEDLLP